MLSDRVGRKPLMYVATIGTVLLAWPLWWLMNHEHLSAIFAGQAGFGVLFAVGFAGVPALMAELLPAEIRCTGIGIGYNVAIGIFGGAAPLVATYLISRTGNDFVPAYYVMAVAAISFIALLGLPETAGTRAEVRPGAS